MMTLVTTLGLVLLLAPQPQKMPRAFLLFQSQESAPVQIPPEQAPIEETKPAQQDNPGPTPQPPDSGTTSTDDPANKPQEPVVKPPSPETPKKSSAAKKPSPKTSKAKKPARKHSQADSSIVVVRNGSTSEKPTQISSGASDQQASQQLKNANSLLGATNANLKKISAQQLNPGQQDMVKQIHNYMRQSKDAAEAGDLQGANTLALKAHLLSEELIKH